MFAVASSINTIPFGESKVLVNFSNYLPPALEFDPRYALPHSSIFSINLLSIDKDETINNTIFKCSVMLCY
jgi:hypothetical protein